MKGLFGLVALLITIAIISYMMLVQLDIFTAGSEKTIEAKTVDGTYYTTEVGAILDPIDKANSAKAALEVKSRIPKDLMQ